MTMKKNTILIKKSGILMLIIVVIINVSGFKYIFHVKDSAAERIRHFIVKVVPPGAYIYAPFLSGLLAIQAPEFKVAREQQFIGHLLPDSISSKNALVSDEKIKIFFLDINNSRQLSYLGQEISPNITSKVSTYYSNNDMLLWGFIHKPLSFGNYLTLYTLKRYP